MYLIDTTYCSKIIDRNFVLINFLQDKFQGSTHIVTSVISQGELVYMVEKSKMKEENQKKVESFLSSIDIIKIDSGVAAIYGELKYRIVSKLGPKKERKKVTMESLGFCDNDLWIAASAISHNFIAVSADGDFLRIKDVDNRLRVAAWPLN